VEYRHATMTRPVRAAATQPMLAFRAAALRRSVYVTWVVLILLLGQGVRNTIIDDPRFLGSAAGFVVVLALSTAVDWDRALPKRFGPWLAWAWATMSVLALGTMATVETMLATTQPLFAGFVVLTGLTLDRAKHAFVSVLAASLLAMATFLQGTADPVADIVIPVLTVGVVALATALLGAQFEREADRSAERLEELTQQRVDFERLYAVSATLAGAESLDEGLPQLVGTICRFLDAQVGVVFLYQPEDHTLQVVSPMWVNSHTLEVAELRTKVSEGGILPQVFRSGKPMRLDRIGETPEHYGILGELGLSQALVAPLRVEGFSVGVIAVGDPYRGTFRDEQLEQLASLAAPAALVLSQLGRYEAAAEMTRRMQEIARMKTDFVSVVSHELRTPLTSIIGSLDTVVRPELAPQSESARDLLESARRQATRLQRLIEDLLMVSRIDRQAVPVFPESIELQPFLEDVASSITGIDQLTIAVDPPDLVIRADPDHLGRVFINLLENAAKYAEGSPVEIIGRAVKSRVDISVIDHGPGIPAAQRHRVFERFTQVEHSDTRTAGGTGLGLSIVKGLVEAMDGQVALTDTPGGGATFTISLPPASVETFSPV